MCVSMKSLKSLRTKETIYWTKDQSLLTSVHTRTNLPFHCMIAKTKSYGFTGIFLAVFPIGAQVLAYAVYILHIRFSKQKLSSSKRRFPWIILREIFPIKTTRKWHLFVWILLHYNFFVIRYILWLKIAVRHETLSMKI